MLRTSLTALAVSLLTLPAFADEPVEIAEIRFGDALLEKAEDYGPRELDRLADEFRDHLSDALDGIMLDDGMILQARILDASPNRPTREQLRDTPGLSYSLSFSRGGARLEADLITADGVIVESFEYSYHTVDLRDARYRSTWTDADRTMRRFSRTVGEDLRERARTGS